MVPMAMVHRYVLLLPAFLAAAALHRCGLAPSRIGTEASLQALHDAIEELTRQLRLQVAADFKPVLCNFVQRYVRERRLQPRVQHIHGSELLCAVGLPELRAHTMYSALPPCIWFAPLSTHVSTLTVPRVPL